MAVWTLAGRPVAGRWFVRAIGSIRFTRLTVSRPSPTLVGL